MWITFKTNPFKKNIRFLLMLLGSIPFWGTGLCLWYDQTHIFGLSLIHDVLPSYGLIIFIYMTGTYWGLALNQNEMAIKLWSNSFALIAWFGYLKFNFQHFAVFISLLFLLILIFDFFLYKNKQIKKKYFKERILTTTIVVSSIVIIHHTLV